MRNEQIIATGKQLLEAYVDVKSGRVNRGARLFASAVEEGGEAFDVLMNGIGNSIQAMLAGADGTDDETDDFPDDEEMGASADEGEDDTDDEEDPADDEESQVEIPASVAEVLQLKF